MTRNKIIEEIYYSKDINKMIDNIVAYQDVDEFKSIFYEEICKLKEDYLINIYNNNGLLFVCTRIVINQYRSKTSRYYKECKEDKSKKWIKKISDKEEKYLEELGIDKNDLYDVVTNIRVVDLSMDNIPYEQEDFSERFDAEIEEDINIEYIKESIRKLKMKEQAIVEYRLFNNLRVKDISNKTGIPESTISCIYSKAIQNIKKHLDGYNNTIS